ncbi:MAG: neutral/alkaline non-lysosomal ceramidase N-terminal domain-containing protein [Chloroflexota bacterium]
MSDILEIGAAEVEITPTDGTATTLSGFIFRENKLALGVIAPIFVRALCLSQNGILSMLISYEILGISRELECRVLSTLKTCLGDVFAGERCVLTATHNHSAPPVCSLQGELEPNPAYLQWLCDQTLLAVQEAMRKLTPAKLFSAQIRIPGLTYNRRAVLADGRVSMAAIPDAPVLERGPVDDMLTVLVWRDMQGRNLAVLLHFACHGAAVCSQFIQGDIPGELAQRVAKKFDAPCLYLQGTTGDINPLNTSGNRKSMIAWVDLCMEYLQDITQKVQPLPSVPFRMIMTDLPLVFCALPQKAIVEKNIKGLEQIAEGDKDSLEIQETLRLLADIMNFKPGQRPDPSKAAFCAQALEQAERRTLNAILSGQLLSPCPLRVGLWQIGQVGFAFIAAELFALSGIKIRAAGKNMMLLPVTYAGPIVGYIPDRVSIEKGGYEVNDAWRFYRQPGAFMPETEEMVVTFIQKLAANL